MQAPEQNLEIWYTHSAWFSIMHIRQRNRDYAAQHGKFPPLFTGDRRNITTREEGDYVVVRMHGFVPDIFGAADVLAVPHEWQMRCEKMIDLRTNKTFRDRGRMNNAVH